MIKQAYSSKFYPPAPVCQVRLAFPDQSPRIGPLAALMDTGADGTFVPTDYLEQLQVPVEYMTNVRAHVGRGRYQRSVHIIDLVFSDTLRLPEIEVVSDDWGDQIILGRNVLNKLKIMLDGPKLFISISG